MKDPYIQKNGTLKNKLNITDYHELSVAERNITFSKFLDVRRLYKGKFDIDYIKSIHKHIFENIFDWAGEFRTVPIIKEEVVIPMRSLDYTPHKNIAKEMKKVLDEMNSTNWDSMELSEKSKIFTKQLAKLWKIHPFRDGNTRTTLAFGKQFSEEHGFPMDLGYLLDHLTRIEHPETGKILRHSIRDKFVLAALPDEYYPQPEFLTELLHSAMEYGIAHQKDCPACSTAMRNMKKFPFANEFPDRDD